MLTQLKVLLLGGVSPCLLSMTPLGGFGQFAQKTDGTASGHCDVHPPC